MANTISAPANGASARRGAARLSMAGYVIISATLAAFLFCALAAVADNTPSELRGYFAVGAALIAAAALALRIPQTAWECRPRL